jgi:hypothetical protein
MLEWVQGGGIGYWRDKEQKKLQVEIYKVESNGDFDVNYTIQGYIENGFYVIITFRYDTGNYLIKPTTKYVKKIPMKSKKPGGKVWFMYTYNIKTLKQISTEELLVT